MQCSWKQEVELEVEEVEEVVVEVGDTGDMEVEGEEAEIRQWLGSLLWAP